MSGRTAPNQFLNGPNYQKIVGFLRQHYAKKLGMQAIHERMDARLQKTVQHYMTEVSRLQGNRPVNALTQEVLRETTTSMDTWLTTRQESGISPVATTIGAFSKSEEYGRLHEDPNARFEALMSERAPPAQQTPAPMPDFLKTQSFMDSNEDPILLMERMQKERESQARILGIPASPASTPSLEIRDVSPSAANPIPPQAETAPPLLAPRPQAYIIPQEDVVKYKETEYNIFITSSDRDWLRNTSENRYNFSVNFNTGSKKTGFTYSPSIQERFRNIQRIEFVKAIVPTESLTSLVRVIPEEDGSSYSYDTTRVINVFSLPFAHVRIAELNGNGFSTNPAEDNTFAMVQYDTTWSSDQTAQAQTGVSPSAVLGKSGYTGMIPKFLKCQRVYPNLLGTLQRLSLRLERHDGQLLTSDSDVLQIKRIVLSNSFGSVGGNNTIYSVTSPQNSYIFVQTWSYFPYSAVSEGDRIALAGYTPTTVSDAASDFANYMNREEGHYVVATGYVSTGVQQLSDGRNNAGYCNVIILRSRFDDPTTGSTDRTASYYGGSVGADDALSTALDGEGEANASGTALINMNRQTHFVLRIVTRDYDAASNTRPDNV